MSTEATQTRAPSWRARRLAAQERSTRTAVAEVALVAAMLAALVVYVAPTLDAPLLEKHAFRQTQTAFTAREFHERGIDFLHPKLPVFGEPFEAPFEFPLYQAVATVPMKLGVAEDTALRATSLAFFLLTAVLLYGLVRYVAGPVSGVAAVLAFTFTPLALLWSRTSMIEYVATAGAVGFAWALIVWRDTRRPSSLALALVAGLVGMLVKPTTAVFWLLPPLVYRPAARPSDRRARRPDLGTLVAVSVPLAAAMLWTRHADAIKAASPVTEWLTGWNLRRWNVGWTRQRLDPDQWWIIGERIGPNVVGLFGLLLLPALVAGLRSSQRWFWIAVVGTATLPLLVLMNLYIHHDYYLVAISPAVAALVGLGAGWLWSVIRPRWLVAALPVVAVVLAWGTLELGRGYWLRIHGDYDDPQVLPLAGEIRSHTRPDDLVAVVGLDWTPAVLYYAHRRGHMVTEHAPGTAYDLIHGDGYRHILVVDAAHDDLGFMARWGWVSSLGPHLYGVADAAAELPRSPLVAVESDAGLARRLAASPPVPGAPATIPCDEPTALPSGSRGTWIRLEEPGPGARLFVGDRAPVPAREAIFVAPPLSRDGTVVVTCTGADALRVAGVVDAAAPGRRP
jgi:hypothetical protein